LKSLRIEANNQLKQAEELYEKAKTIEAGLEPGYGL
jgi:hypothetical protein